MARSRVVLVLYFCMEAYKAACHMLSKATVEISEDIVQILSTLKVPATFIILDVKNVCLKTQIKLARTSSLISLYILKFF